MVNKLKEENKRLNESLAQNNSISVQNEQLSKQFFYILNKLVQILVDNMNEKYEAFCRLFFISTITKIRLYFAAQYT